MVVRNSHLAKLKAGYLFPEINKRKMAFLASHPGAKLISLGIGDTTEPIVSEVVSGLHKRVEALGTKQGYTGYGPEQGEKELREKLAQLYHQYYNHKVDADEIFISDGSKCDIGRLQVMFGANQKIAVQDPSYPVYVDTSIIMGQPEIVYLKCDPSNDFFPDLEKAPKANLLYFCSPNNPTGAAATKEQLTYLVEYCRKNKMILIFDSAYAAYIQDRSIPKSIYEIEGADEVAIELGSFSKIAGFTGVRLAWSVVPKKLMYEDQGSVHKDWSRINSTFFNGASNIAQTGALYAISPEGQKAIKSQIQFYLENASILRSTLKEMDFDVYGGDNAPYLWVHIPGKTSWDAFEEFLYDCHIVTTPGLGFGPAGEGFVRFSAFGSRENILECSKRLKLQTA